MTLHEDGGPAQSGTAPIPGFQAAVLEHPEARCDRCFRPNVWSWHAPSPLWNAVMRGPTGADAYSVVCPPCFAELAEAKGLHYIWHFGPHEDITDLWADSDGRVWDPTRCLWIEPVTVAGKLVGEVELP